jgi:hypothetical protein
MVEYAESFLRLGLRRHLDIDVPPTRLGPAPGEPGFFSTGPFRSVVNGLGSNLNATFNIISTSLQ